MQLARLALAITSLSACAHEQPVAALPLELEGEQVMVSTRGGAEVPATVQGGALRMPDGQLVPLSSVGGVTDVEHGRGALEGLGLGAVVGAGAGIVAGLASGDDPPCGANEFLCFRFSAGDKAVVGGILLGVAGGVVGLVYGAVTGSDVVYTGGSAVRLAPPAGSTSGLTFTF